MQNLFSVKKVGLYLDAIAHSLETRKTGDTKIITLTLRQQPFDHKLAGAMDDVVRRTLFKLNSPNDVAPYLRAVAFALPVPRQRMTCYASSDTVKATILLDQVKIHDMRARLEKSIDGWGLVFKASFGPAGKAELEYVEQWRTSQAFITFEEAEPSMDFAADEDDEEGEAEPPARAAHMFDDPRDEPVATAAGADRAQHKMHSHAPKARGKKS